MKKSTISSMCCQQWLEFFKGWAVNRNFKLLGKFCSRKDTTRRVTMSRSAALSLVSSFQKRESRQDNLSWAGIHAAMWYPSDDLCSKGKA
jgi:hypothetical protein